MRFRRALPLLLLVPGATTGCAGHATTMHDVREALAHGDLEGARARLAESGRGTDDLLFALEDGLLLHYSGQPELSNERLAFAEVRIDDLYTRSLTKTALSLITSDLVLHFEPRGVEPFLIHYYRALNFLALGDPGSARVEWRRLAHELQFAAETGDAAYLDPPFFNHLVGLGLEPDDPDQAYVAFRRAEVGYREAGTGVPPDLVGDLIRLAGRLGHRDHLDEYLVRYPAPESGPARAGPGYAGSGPSEAQAEIVVLVEDGFVAPIEEVRAYIPILTDRMSDVRGAEDDRLDLARRLAAEYRAGRYAGVSRRHVRRKEIAYVLPLAFPTPGRAVPGLRDLQVDAGLQPVSGHPVLDVSALQARALEDRLPSIYVKMIARALTKFALAQKLAEEAEDEAGEDAGAAVKALSNVINVVTERADTRAWLGLPHRIWMARLRVPAGEHEIYALLDGEEEILLETVRVRPGERRFVTTRIF